MADAKYKCVICGRMGDGMLCPLCRDEVDRKDFVRIEGIFRTDGEAGRPGEGKRFTPERD